ncbi:hypothetical protein [Sphaerisporangium fuscum]|uniref:hypothetical protein n=1 Tax=Sphaerisporangium fuscum TaxID=2835868 RepID=UPI0027E2430D|nr:hypothetical protein [Sphaerisporangium fuscum]
MNTISPAQARLVAEEYFNGPLPAAEAVEVGLYPFEEGYVAWAKAPEPDDPGALPSLIGGGCVVIDRLTGEVSIRPLLNPEAVADHWRARRPR